MAELRFKGFPPIKGVGDPIVEIPAAHVVAERSGETMALEAQGTTLTVHPPQSTPWPCQQEGCHETQTQWVAVWANNRTCFQSACETHVIARQARRPFPNVR